MWGLPARGPEAALAIHPALAFNPTGIALGQEDEVPVVVALGIVFPLHGEVPVSGQGTGLFVM